MVLYNCNANGDPVGRGMQILSPQWKVELEVGYRLGSFTDVASPRGLSFNRWTLISDITLNKSHHRALAHTWHLVRFY
jgi:hypothetical protein